MAHCLLVYLFGSELGKMINDLMNVVFCVLKTWNDKFIIESFMYQRKTYASTACKTVEEEKEIQDKIISEKSIRAREAQTRTDEEIKKKELLEQEETARLENQKKEEELVENSRLEAEQKEKAAKETVEFEKVKVKDKSF